MSDLCQVPARPTPKFLLSGMSQEEKIDYSALIEALGGVVKDGMYFDPTCTHLVVGESSLFTFADKATLIRFEEHTKL